MEFELNYKRTVKPENYESITVELKRIFSDKNFSYENAQIWLEAFIHKQVNRQLRTLALNGGDSHYISVLKKQVSVLNGVSDDAERFNVNDEEEY